MVYLLRLVSVDNHATFKRNCRVAWLWGYPDLIEKLYGEVRPALVEEREKRRESKKEEERGTIVEHLNDVSEVMDENKDDTASAITQFRVNPTVPFVDGSRPLFMAQIDSQPDSETLPIDHPPAPDERHLSTVIIEDTEVLGPTSGSQIPQPSIGEAATLPNKTENVPGISTFDANDVCVVQSKDESGK